MEKHIRSLLSTEDGCVLLRSPVEDIVCNGPHAALCHLKV